MAISKSFSLASVLFCCVVLCFILFYFIPSIHENRGHPEWKRLRELEYQHTVICINEYLHKIGKHDLPWWNWVVTVILSSKVFLIASCFLLLGAWIFFFIFFGFLQHMEVPRLGVELELSYAGLRHSNTGIRAASATYTIAHSNTRSLTHWARPGIKPATS